MISGTTRFRVTFSENISLEEIQLFIDSDFGGFGRASKGESDRVLYISSPFEPFPSDVLEKQLAAFQDHGVIQEWKKLSSG